MSFRRAICELFGHRNKAETLQEWESFMGTPTLTGRRFRRLTCLRCGGTKEWDIPESFNCRCTLAPINQKESKTNG